MFTLAPRTEPWLCVQTMEDKRYTQSIRNYKSSHGARRVKPGPSLPQKQLLSCPNDEVHSCLLLKDYLGDGGSTSSALVHVIVSGDVGGMALENKMPTCGVRAEEPLRPWPTSSA